jgi:hypothetical protein
MMVRVLLQDVERTFQVHIHNTSIMDTSIHTCSIHTSSIHASSIHQTDKLYARSNQDANKKPD